MSDTWHAVAFSVAEMADGVHANLQRAFSDIFVLTAAPRDAGMFKHRDLSVNVYYFSPGAARIALRLIQQYHGVPCDPPSRDSVYSCVSHAGAEDVPFAR